MLDRFRSWGPATVLLGLLGLIIVTAGALVAIINPDTYPFREYLEDLQQFAYALGALAVGRGIMKSGEAKVQAETLRTMSNRGDIEDEHAHGH